MYFGFKFKIFNKKRKDNNINYQSLPIIFYSIQQLFFVTHLPLFFPS